MRYKILVTFIIGLVFLFSNLSSPFARTITLTWEPNNEPDLAGYIVFVGLASADYDTSYPVGKEANEYQLELSSDENDYFLALKAFDNSGNESEFSAEVVVDGNGTSTGDPSIPPVRSQEAAGYASLYKYGQTVSYCSQVPCNSTGGYCRESAYPCGQEYPYKYTGKMAGFMDLYNLNESSILCGREDDDSCVPLEKSLVFDLVTLQGAGLNYVSVIPGYFRLYIPPGTFHGKISIYVPHNVDKGVVVRYKQPPEFGGAYAGVTQWDSPDDVTLDSLTERDIFLQRKDGMIDGVLTFSRPAMSESDAGWLYFRVLSATTDLTIHKIWAKFDVNVDEYLGWYDRIVGDVVGDPWLVDNGETSALEDCWADGGIWYNGECRQSMPTSSSSGYSGSGSGGSYSPPSSGSSSSGSSSSGFGSFSGLGSLFGLQPPPCGPDNPGGCDQGACEALGDDYWWYGSCRSRQQIETYDGRIAEAPVRLGAAADDGIISAGEGMSILLDVPGDVRTYAVLVFPNDDHLYFIDNNRIITPSVVSVISGEVQVSDNLCAMLEEVPELTGEWLVAFLTVPSTVDEFQSLDDIVDYLNSGGTYHFGSYGVMVDCQ